jgi:hypothetical protein
MTTRTLSDFLLVFLASLVYYFGLDKKATANCCGYGFISGG